MIAIFFVYLYRKSLISFESIIYCDFVSYMIKGIHHWNCVLIFNGGDSHPKCKQCHVVQTN